MDCADNQDNWNQLNCYPDNSRSRCITYVYPSPPGIHFSSSQNSKMNPCSIHGAHETGDYDGCKGKDCFGSHQNVPKPLIGFSHQFETAPINVNHDPSLPSFTTFDGSKESSLRKSNQGRKAKYDNLGRKAARCVSQKKYATKMKENFLEIKREVLTLKRKNEELKNKKIEQLNACKKLLNCPDLPQEERNVVGIILGMNIN